VFAKEPWLLRPGSPVQKKPRLAKMRLDHDRHDPG
jgi:hypothetical protein